MYVSADISILFNQVRYEHPHKKTEVGNIFSLPLVVRFGLMLQYP